MGEELRDGVGIFDGEVVDVPFLKAPGFIKTSVVDMLLKRLSIDRIRASGSLSVASFRTSPPARASPWRCEHHGEIWLGPAAR